jgi:uncharacterized protein
MIYLDTSVLVSALTTEKATSRVQAWLRENAAEGLAISPWVITEFHSALAMKLRLGIIGTDKKIRIMQEFEYLQRQQLHNFSVKNIHFLAAANFMSQHQLALRAGDALHLAIVADNETTICTLDETLFEASSALGIPCVMP